MQWIPALIPVLALAGPWLGPTPAEADTVSGWWSRGYLVDYAVVAAGGAGYLAGRRITPRSDPLWGPAYDPRAPQEVLGAEGVQHRYRDRHGEVAVPRSWIHWLLGGTGVALTAAEGVRYARGSGSTHRVHETAVGYLETVALTASATALTKPFVGRLRPDFADRALRYHCQSDLETLGDACQGDEPALSPDPEEAADLLDDGQRSFFSGHSSHAFNLFGYAALVVGGRHVWGADASSGRRAAGVAGQAGMMGAAGWIAWSRVSDRRHHASDVAVGTAVGLGFANFSYWRRFHRSGEVRRGSDPGTPPRVQLLPWASTSQAGLAVDLRTR